MSVSYRAVGWNRQKLFYDAALLTGLAIYVLGFITLSPKIDPNVEPMNVRIRAFGSAAFILLNVILSIGPLTRLDKRFLPLLYNRRHMGVAMCVLALIHARFAIQWYHDYGDLDPVVSLLVSNTRYDSLVHFPFELLGLAALVILVVMAATSHDFWLANLTAPIWKALHMGVYIAYAFLVAHVLLGAVQSNPNPVVIALMGLSVAWIVSLHVSASLRERRLDRPSPRGADGWVRVGPATEIPNNSARIICASGERIAVFRYDNQVSAISNVCQHQNGPLGEGRIIDGLVTCPWHGYQYRPACGASPPPFAESVPTFDVVVRDGVVYVNPAPHAPGTHVEPAHVDEEHT